MGLLDLQIHSTPGTDVPSSDQDPAEVDHDDRLIHWMLRMTPVQRLEALQNFVDGVTALQHARKVS